VTPTAATKKVEKVECQKTFFDLDTFSDVKLKKEFDFEPVQSMEEAQVRLGNDAKRLVKILNEGLTAELRRKEYANPLGWSYLEDGEMGKSFTGTLADQKVVNAAILNLAKNSIAPSEAFDLDWDSATKDQKTKIREATVAFIQQTPIIKNGLKRSARLKEEETEDNGE